MTYLFTQMLIGTALLVTSTNLVANVFLPNSFRAQFTQSYTSSLKNKIKTSKGVIEYQYPGNIYFSTEGTQKIIYVSNRTQNWYYVAPFLDGEPGELNN